MHECSMTLHIDPRRFRRMGESWQVRYLRHVKAVVEKRGESLSSVAGAAGLRSTTLTRPLGPGHKFQVKLTTLEAVQRVTGLPFAPFQPGGEAEDSEAVELSRLEREFVARLRRSRPEQLPKVMEVLDGVLMLVQGVARPGDSEGVEPEAGSDAGTPG